MPSTRTILSSSRTINNSLPRSIICCRKWMTGSKLPTHQTKTTNKNPPYIQFPNSHLTSKSSPFPPRKVTKSLPTNQTIMKTLNQCGIKSTTKSTVGKISGMMKSLIWSNKSTAWRISLILLHFSKTNSKTSESISELSKMNWWPTWKTKRHKASNITLQTKALSNVNQSWTWFRPRELTKPSKILQKIPSKV